MMSCEREDTITTFTDKGNIGPAGGIIVTSDGASVEIPEGALTELQSISIKKNTSDNLGTSSEYWAYDLKPDGLNFKDSVTISLPFNDKFLNTIDTIDIQPIRVFLMKDSSLIELETKIDWENNRAIIKTTHFSTYLVFFPSEWGNYFENRGDKSVTLTVPYYEQYGNWCFYYSWSMILKNAGYSYKGPNLASKCLERNPNTTGFLFPVDNVFLPFMTVKGINFNYKQLWFNKVNLFGYIIFCLDDNRPVELLIPNEQHAVVVTGYDKFGLYIHDPNNPSPELNHYSFKDISDDAIGDLYCNTLIIRSTGEDSRLGYTLNFHKYDLTVKENPNDNITIGSLSINGLYMPGYAIVDNSSQTDPDSFVTPGSFNGKDYIVLNPIIANADSIVKPVILQVKFDANEIPHSQRLIEISQNNLDYQDYEPLVSRLENLNKGWHTITVELRSEDNESLYDSWQFDLNIANEFLVTSPIAAFTASSRTITAGQSVQFTDQSTNSPTSWSWNFGDGGTSTVRNPSHLYSTAGTYTVKLTATNNAGSDEELKSNYITVNPVASGIVFNPNLTYGTISDTEGNIYKTIKIGTQTWMAENLRTTKFNNGTEIPNITGNEWSSLNEPAYCWHNNNISFKLERGALYNWFTVSTGKLCPTGWHVPSRNEWITLIKYAGGELSAGKALKETGTGHWKPINDGINSSGFTAVPGGIRWWYPGFDPYPEYEGYYWYSDQVDIYRSYALRIRSYESKVLEEWYEKRDGFSVRCIQD